MSERWLRMDDVRDLFGGRSRASVYRDIARGDLPPPVKMGQVNYWSESRLRAWVANREAASSKDGRPRKPLTAAE